VGKNGETIRTPCETDMAMRKEKEKSSGETNGITLEGLEMDAPKPSLNKTLKTHGQSGELCCDKKKTDQGKTSGGDATCANGKAKRHLSLPNGATHSV